MILLFNILPRSESEGTRPSVAFLSFKEEATIANFSGEMIDKLFTDVDGN